MSTETQHSARRPGSAEVTPGSQRISINEGQEEGVISVVLDNTADVNSAVVSLNLTPDTCRELGIALMRVAEAADAMDYIYAGKDVAA